MKGTFIAWSTYDGRSALMAQHLGITMHYVHYGQHGNLLQAPLRYLRQTITTWRVLRRERPEVVFASNPPIFCPLVVAIYAKVHRIRYAIDSHSGAFLSPTWRWSLGLHRVLSRGAITTLVPNDYAGSIVSGWGCPVSVLGYTPHAYPAGERFPLDGDYNIAVVSSFDPDEPLPAVFQAARRLPQVHFYVTGDSTRASSELLKVKPSNCHLTGFLSYERYIGLLREVNAILDLTNDDHTLLMGAYEAVSLGKPLITSDWPILRSYFSSGTIHVPNTDEGIYEGVERAQREERALQDGMLGLREHLVAEWDEKFGELVHVLEKP